MEIRRWHLYIIIGCVLVSHFEAKTVSLNELIAAESNQKQEKVPRPKSDFEPKTAPPNKFSAAEAKQKQEKVPCTKSAETASIPRSLKEALPAESRQKERKRAHKILAKSPRRQSFSLKDLFAAEAKETRRKLGTIFSKTRGAALLSNRRSLLPHLSFHNIESTESLLSRAKTLSPLGFRRTFEIKSPLRPKRLKHSFYPHHGRQKQSTKREIFENGQFSQKEIPLIKRLGLLVDDILSTGSGESYEAKPKYRQERKKIRDRRERKCKCDEKPDLESAESKPDKKAVTIATTVSPEITTVAEDTPTEASATAANNTAASDVYTVRPDPNLSLLLTRNTTSRRRDYYGFSERSSPPFYGNVEGNIAWNNGNDEHHSRGEGNQACSPDNEENPCGSARNDASSVGSIDGLYGNGTNTRDPDYRHETEKTKVSGDDDGFVRGVDAHEKEKFQVGRKTEETIQTAGSLRLRGTLPEYPIAMEAEPVQPKKTRQESFFNVTYNYASPERIAQRNGAAATEDQKLRPAVETVMPMNSLKPSLLEMNRQPNQIVTIFDGYSIARDINGRNRLSEKSIHISSK